jgi:hypothetical protein
VRTGDLLPEAAADPHRGTDDLYIVWQDIRSTLAAPLPFFNDQNDAGPALAQDDARR